MSSYLVEPQTIATVSINTGIDARQIGILNLKATGWRYDLTPSQVAKQFLGLSKKEYLRLCEEYEPYLYLGIPALLDEVIYQCGEGEYDQHPIYKALVQAREGLK